MCSSRDCLWCNNYEKVLYGERCINRLIHGYRHTYVIVPQESHVTHHLVVFLREHRDSLIDCDEQDLRRIGETVAKACKVLKSMGYDRVYAGCYSDDPHVHYHLIPFNKAADKLYDGRAMHWLAEKERVSAAHPFDGLTGPEKLARLDEMEIVVREVCSAWPPGG
jgi:diadenosine tetraphosphate (Ap4A) HIT family hydrolase